MLDTVIHNDACKCASIFDLELWYLTGSSRTFTGSVNMRQKPAGKQSLDAPLSVFLHRFRRCLGIPREDCCPAERALSLVNWFVRKHLGVSLIVAFEIWVLIMWCRRISLTSQRSLMLCAHLLAKSPPSSPKRPSYLTTLFIVYDIAKTLLYLCSDCAIPCS